MKLGQVFTPAAWTPPWLATSSRTMISRISFRRLCCVLGMLSSLEVRVLRRPDGGEGLVKMQGLSPRGEV